MLSKGNKKKLPKDVTVADEYKFIRQIKGSSHANSAVRTEI